MHIYVREKLGVTSRVVETGTATSHVYNWKCLFSLFR